MNKLEIALKTLNEGRADLAAQMFDALVVSHPEKPEPYLGLGVSLYRLEKMGGAIAALNHAVSIAPDDPDTWAALGGVLKHNEHYEAARECFRRCIKIDPNHVGGLTGMAGSYVNQGEPDPGIPYARKALKLNPDNIHALNDLALLLLEKGDWEEGWKRYGERYRHPNYHVRDFGGTPRWDGGRVKRLAISPEQGLGDEILFASCLPDVLREVDSVCMEVAPRLLEFFKRSFPQVSFYGSHEEMLAKEKPNAWERLMDLPDWYRFYKDMCPGTPYMKADEAKVLGYRKRLEALGPGPYVGIAWKGGTKTTHEKLRNPPIELWSEIVTLPGTFVSLQYGDQAHVAEALNVPHWPKILEDLDEQAALIKACDLVITVCQTALHISGSMGVPTWVLTPKKTSWAFAGSDEKMPWYNSVRLIREKSGWPEMFERVARDYQATYAIKGD